MKSVIFIQVRPCKGYRRIKWDLRDLGYNVNHKRVYRLMKLMGLQGSFCTLEKELEQKMSKQYIPIC